MDWPEEKLKEVAEEIAAELSDKVVGLEAQLAKIKDDLETAKGAPMRAAAYVPMIDGQLQCPECFVKNGRKSVVVQTAKTERADTYRCLTCKERLRFWL